MNIELLIQYQNRERKFNEDYNKYINHENYRLFTEQLKEYKEKKKELNRIEDSTSKVTSTSNLFNEECDCISEEIESLETGIDKCISFEEVTEFEEKMNEINNKIYKLNSFIRDMENHEAAQIKLAEQKAQLDKLEKDVKESYPFYLDLKKLYEEKIESVAKADLNKIKEELSKEEIEAYESAKKANNEKPPYICEYNKGFCSGCHKDVEAEVGRIITNAGSCICPECHKILYIKK